MKNRKHMFTRTEALKVAAVLVIALGAAAFAASGTGSSGDLTGGSSLITDSGGGGAGGGGTSGGGTGGGGVLGAALTVGSSPLPPGNLAAPLSLKTVVRPEPTSLGLYLKSDPANLNADGFPIVTPAARAAAIALGKALFWDMQVGSDGVQACASCHSHAGADIRAKNTMNPGQAGGDNTFQTVGPNGTVTPAMFPFTKFADPEDRFSPILSDTNDVIGAQGVHNTTFVAVPRTGAVEQGTVAPDSVFNVRRLNTRRVTGRNAPSVINAVFNFNNFWDGRANNRFNGNNPFGDADVNAGIFVTAGATMSKQHISIPNSSLASQATGPPGNPTEMSFAGRSWADIGRKVLKCVPLAKQQVHVQDSVLGPMAATTRGLRTNYVAMIQAAFQPQYWNSTQTVTVAGSTQTVGNRSGATLPAHEYTQMEINFSFYFGLAVQMYEATLVSDDSPFDRFQAGDLTAMSPSAQAGLNTFLTPNFDDNGVPLVGGSCINCHTGSVFTNADTASLGAPRIPGDALPEGLIERMAMGDGGGAFYDHGYYNIGVRPTEEDVGRGGLDGFGFPLSWTQRALLVDNGTVLPFFNPLLPNPTGGPVGSPNPLQRAAVDGAFKTPTLRNVELTGPYFHNGSSATLMQVLDHYTRGGSFNERNIANLAPDIQANPAMRGNDVAQRQVIDFLIALTDERVRFEKAPFDHPALQIPNGAPGTALNVTGAAGQAGDAFINLPAVGAAGLPKASPLGRFLGLDPHTP